MHVCTYVYTCMHCMHVYNVYIYIDIYIYIHIYIYIYVYIGMYIIVYICVYIAVDGLLSVRKGIYFRLPPEGFPWPARSYQHTESHPKIRRLH